MNSQQRKVRGTSASRKARPRNLVALLAIAATILLPGTLTPAGAATSDKNGSISDLQRERQKVRQQAAAKASQVDTLKASDAEITAALQALDVNVNAQRDRLEESERAVTQARTEQAAAEAAQAAKQKELDELVAQLKESAVSSYISMGTAGAVTVSSDDINDTVNKRTLMSVKANESITLTEHFRSVQEDLETQRQIATEAHAKAESAEKAVASRLTQLDAAFKEQQKFADQVDQRLNAALAEADSLAQTDASLAKSISSKQVALARQLAAQRAADEARAARRSSGNRPTSSSSLGGGGNSGGGGAIPSITGSGEIVNVNGIRVHRSIANNLARLLAAASSDGIQLSGGGFRDPQGQIAVRKSNCGTSNYAIYQMPASSCRPPTARPGTSMHERGLAVDFTQGGRTLTRSSSGFAWMRSHAAAYGFYNLPSEAWHWSTNGN
ncbi:MAG: D-alanyl-D-alanine carboxypeptidase family protein [Microthrixaceae bacterium]